TVDVVEMVLAGSINKAIVSTINRAGGTAIGICGKDGNLIQARKLRRRRRDPVSNVEQILDLGFVGEPEYVNPQILTALEQAGMIPVIAPLGVGPDGETYNINADTVAGAVAAAVGAVRLLLLTDVQGVLDRPGGVVSTVETCSGAAGEGGDAAVILDGRAPHAVLREVVTDKGVGTRIRRS